MDFDKPFDGDISKEALERWLAQFSPDEQPVIQELVRNLRYYSVSRVYSLLRSLHQRLQDALGDISQAFFAPVGYVAKSGSAVAYFYRKQNDIASARFVSLRDIPEVLTPGSTLILLDDFIGSGHQARQLWTTVLAPVVTSISDCKVAFGALVGLSKGIAYLKETTAFRVVVAEEITEEQMPFSATSKIFRSAEEKNRALEILQKYGERLYPKYPLGYAASQLLLGFFYSTPNNTCPIFWSTENGWEPLLPRGESFRDLRDLIGPPAGLPRGVVSPAADRPRIQDAAIEQYDIAPDLLLKLVGEFKSTLTSLVIGKIIGELGMTAATVGALLDAVNDLKHAAHEKVPVRSSLLVLPKGGSFGAAGTSVFTVGDGTTLSARGELLALAQLIDGLVGAVVADSDGTILGGSLFQTLNASSDRFLPQRYRAAASASETTSGLLFLFAGGGGGISVFHRGVKILSHRGATWHLHNSALDRAVIFLAAQHHVKPSTLEHVLRLAFLLSDEGRGGLLTVGDHENVLARSKQLNAGNIRWNPLTVDHSADAVLLGLIAQDGATVVSSDGQVIQGMAWLLPPDNVKAEPEVGRGTKHSTAAQVAASTNTICVTIASDGRVTLYSKGAIVFKMMG